MGEAQPAAGYSRRSGPQYGSAAGYLGTHGGLGGGHSAAQQLDEMAQASGTDWALGTSAGARAQVSIGPAAETLYCEAIERLSRTEVRMALARTRLLYGEWLRRENRRIDAREQLSRTRCSAR
ncbi:hypothetical protein OHA25_13995 [Nonomuraea sp. NBC_00507]|uniref:hypothetical protein n=1 Tax=Nonomuraea sp. NBC_00507 TaxID=2976002 RepID=UPI002E18726F